MEKEDGLGVKFTKWTKVVVSILDTIIVFVIIFHFLYLDIPPLSTLPNSKLMLLFSSIISLFGFIIGFKYDGSGGVIIIYGFMLFWILSVTHNYSFHVEWLTTGSPLSGIMHLFIWRRTSGKKILGRTN